MIGDKSLIGQGLGLESWARNMISMTRISHSSWRQMLMLIVIWSRCWSVLYMYNCHDLISSFVL